MDRLHTSWGSLRYSNDNGYRLVVEVDQGLADYYRSLIPKWYNPCRPRWPAHITVVRAEKEVPTILAAWGKYEGQEVEFKYDASIGCGKVYFWLNCLSTRLEEIRTELGLPVSSEWTRPPEGYQKFFHCTIANLKNA